MANHALQWTFVAALSLSSDVLGAPVAALVVLARRLVGL